MTRACGVGGGPLRRRSDVPRPSNLSRGRHHRRLGRLSLDIRRHSVLSLEVGTTRPSICCPGSRSLGSRSLGNYSAGVRRPGSRSLGSRSLGSALNIVPRTPSASVIAKAPACRRTAARCSKELAKVVKRHVSPYCMAIHLLKWQDE